MSGMLGAHLVEHGPDALVIGVIGAAGKGDLRAFRQSSSVSARRRAAMKSRLSIMAAVRCLWLTRLPARGRQAEPVSVS